MHAMCTYCRAMTTSAPSHPGRPRLCSNCLRPYEPNRGTLPAALGSMPVCTRGMAQIEPVASPLASVAPQGPTPSLPTRAPEQRARAGGDYDAPRTTPTGADAICPYLRFRNTAQTVHLTPQKQNACYARLRQQDSWCHPSPWVASTPIPVSQEYQAHYYSEVYTRRFYCRPGGTLEVQTTNSDKLSGRSV
jgi:hypothetical protein